MLGRVQAAAVGVLLAVGWAGSVVAAPPSGAAPTAGVAPDASAAPDEASTAEPAAAQPAAGESPVTLTTRLSPDPSYVGDVLTLEVNAAFARGYSVNLPIGVDFSPLYLIDVQEGEPQITGEGLRKTITVRLQHFAPGPAQVPGFSLTYVDPSGAIQTLAVPPVGFTVDALLANETEPTRKPEDPPISIEYPNTLLETVVYAVTGTLLGVLLLWLLLRRFLRRSKPAVVIPEIPAHVVALAALEELERGTLLADGRVQDYYVNLTEIGKGYIERRFGIDALDRTTDEIRRTLLAAPAAVAPLGADDIIVFLQRSDLVKFARMQPDGDEARDALGTVRTLVERSLPTQAAAANEAPTASDKPDADRSVTSDEPAAADKPVGDQPIASAKPDDSTGTEGGSR